MCSRQAAQIQLHASAFQAACLGFCIITGWSIGSAFPRHIKSRASCIQAGIDNQCLTANEGFQSSLPCAGYLAYLGLVQYGLIKPRKAGRSVRKVEAKKEVNSDEWLKGTYYNQVRTAF